MVPVSLKRDKAMTRAEEQLNKHIERLTRSNDDLYQFAYLAAHELQAPLVTIDGFLSLLQSKYASQLPEEANFWVEETLGAAGRMRSMIHALLTLSRVDSQDVEFEPIDSRAALEDALKNLQPVIKDKNARIEIGNLPELKANPTLLMLLFQNLISNALKFSEAPLIEITAKKEDSGWLFSVSDNGVGFDMRYVDQLFNRFKRLHAQAQYPGTGLGLALCKRIVERHGGSIWAQSRPDIGTTIFFTIPLTTTPS